MSLDHQALEGMLTRLHLTAIRDQLDHLLGEAAKRELTPHVKHERKPSAPLLWFQQPQAAGVFSAFSFVTRGRGRKKGFGISASLPLKCSQAMRMAL